MKLAIHVKDICITICFTRVIQVPGLVAKESGINHIILVESEHVAVTDSQLIVICLTFVSKSISDFLSYILDDNVFGVKPKSKFIKILLSTYCWHANKPFLWILLVQTSTSLGCSLDVRYFMAMFISFPLLCKTKN